MSFRRSKDAASEKQRWRSFLRAHTRELNATGLPESILADKGAFDHWLMHGHHPADSTGFTIEQMHPGGRSALVRVLTAYFQEGFQDPGVSVLSPEEMRSVTGAGRGR